MSTDLMLSRTTAHHPPAKPIRRPISFSTGLMLVAPVIIYLFLLQAYPLGSSIITSLTDKRIGSAGTFIGLGNYIALSQDSLFWRAAANTLIFTIGTVIAKLVFGMIMALVLNQPLPFQSIWRALLFVPWTIPTIVTVLTFNYMYSSTGGVFNHLLLKSGLLSVPFDWLGKPANAMFAVMLVNIWRGTPFFGISLLGALQSIPQEMYEAAEIDGASRIQQFTSLTLPMVRPVMILVTLVSTIWTLNDFQIVWVLTRGGPANSTQLFSTLTYTEAFLNLNLAKGIAISAASIPFVAILIWVTTRSLLKQEG